MQSVQWPLCLSVSLGVGRPIYFFTGLIGTQTFNCWFNHAPIMVILPLVWDIIWLNPPVVSWTEQCNEQLQLAIFLFLLSLWIPKILILFYEQQQSGLQSFPVQLQIPPIQARWKQKSHPLKTLTKGSWWKRGNFCLAQLLKTARHFFFQFPHCASASSLDSRTDVAPFSSRKRGWIVWSKDKRLSGLFFLGLILTGTRQNHGVLSPR